MLIVVPSQNVQPGLNLINMIVIPATSTATNYLVCEISLTNILVGMIES